MSKVDKLRALYQELEFDTPAERELLGKVKNRQATEQEVDDLLSIIAGYPHGGRKLDDIKNFENDLVSEMNGLIDDLIQMETEATEVAHLEDEAEIKRADADMKVRYKEIVKKAEEAYDALKEAYFQVDDFGQYNDRFYEAKKNVSHLEWKTRLPFSRKC